MAFLCYSTFILTKNLPRCCQSPTAMILYFPMILLATSCLRKQPDITPHPKKSERTQRHKEAEGAAAMAAVSDPTEDSGHSNSERMLMRLLWSLRCFPCFQHLQGPHGARSIKTTKWEIWTFFCDAGGLFAFQPGRPFSVPPRGGGGGKKIRKRLQRGVWTGKLFRRNMVYLQNPK